MGTALKVTNFLIREIVLFLCEMTSFKRKGNSESGRVVFLKPVSLNLKATLTALFTIDLTVFLRFQRGGVSFQPVSKI